MPSHPLDTLKRVLRSPFAMRARWREAWIDSRVEHELAVAAIFREEALFLDEWLTFHAGIGVTHFYLYNNFSTDHFRDVLQPWIRRGMVTLRDWPVRAGQLPAYRDCFRCYANAARWIAFIDIDEFLFSPRQVDIRPILAEYRDLPGVVVYSPYFGSSGHLTRPQGSILQAFVRRAPLSRVSAKTIANPRWIRAIRNVHLFKYWSGNGLNTNREAVEADTTPNLEVLRLNHYWSKSIEDLTAKVRRGDASTPEPRELKWHLEFEAELNAEEDRTIIPISEAVFGRSRGISTGQH